MHPPNSSTIQMPSVEQSRQRILDAVGDCAEPTLVLLPGNVGDDLILAGTRKLLADRNVREINAEELPFAQGELAMIIGSGGWCHTFTGVMPETLAIAEFRFDRVIVLPSTFEIAAAPVRAALESSGALFFARELESYGQISDICNAQLAHDLAFFADLTAYDNPGKGLLSAFRTDAASHPRSDPPLDNDDISATTDSLDQWLEVIDRHAEIHTDRAHVMIAGALLGKRVRWRPDNYFKVQSLAESTLGGYDVAPLQDQPAPANQPLPQNDADSGQEGTPAPVRELTPGFKDFMSKAHIVRLLMVEAERSAGGEPPDPQRMRALLPQLIDEFDQFDDRARHLLFEMLLAAGGPWVLMQWINGGLDALFGDPDPAFPRLTREHLDWLEMRAEMLAGIEAGNWWRLRGRLRRMVGKD